MNKKPSSTILTIVVILAIGMAIFYYFTSTKQPPSRTKPVRRTLTVETVAAERNDIQAVVTALGPVKAARSVTVYPQVAGRVVSVSPQLIPGGHLKKGENLLRIDASDYELNVRSQQASVAQAELALAQEEGQHAAAKLEWSLIEHEVKPTEEGLRLATREIQLKSAQTALSAARSGLEKAKLDLSRTRIPAPFNAFVTSKGVDVGQVVSSQTPVATLVASDAFWVQVSVPVEKLRWIELPDIHSEGGSQVKISQQIGKGNPQWQGRIIKLLADLDANGKTAQLLVLIEDPFGLKDAENNEKTPLMLGAFVHAEIQGKVMPDVVSLPDRALHEESKVWIRNDEGRLDIRDVELLWRTEENVVVRGPIQQGEAVIVSRIQIPVPGMELLLAGERKTTPAQKLPGAGKKEQKAEVPQ